MADHTPSHGTHGHAEEHSTHHVVSGWIYFWNFVALMILLVITLVAAMFDLHEWNVVIAITIAVVKAVLVVLYFMHMRWNSRLVQVFGGAAIFWLAILFVLTLTDFLSRHNPALVSE